MQALLDIQATRVLGGCVHLYAPGVCNTSILQPEQCAELMMLGGMTSSLAYPACCATTPVDTDVQTSSKTHICVR